MTGFGLWKRIAVGCLTVLIASAALVWHRYHHGEVPGEIAIDVRRIVQRHPDLQPLFDAAMSDGALSMAEVEQIVEAAEATADRTD